MNTLLAIAILSIGLPLSFVAFSIGWRTWSADPEQYENDRRLTGSFMDALRGRTKGTELSAAERRTSKGFAIDRSGRFIVNNKISDQEIERLLRIRRL